MILKIIKRSDDMDYIVVIERLDEDFQSDYQYHVTEKIIHLKNCKDEKDALKKAKKQLINIGVKGEYIQDMLFDNYYYKSTIIPLTGGVYSINE